MKKKSTLNGFCLNTQNFFDFVLKRILLLMLFVVLAVVSNAQFVHEYGYLSEEENVGTKLYDLHILYFALTPGNQLEQDSALMDCSIMLSQKPIEAWTDLSANIRFRNTEKDNYIDARNGGEFATVDSIPFVFGQLYHCWFEIDMMTLSFSLFVQTEGMESPGTIADQYAFRKQDVNELNVWSVVTPTELENILEVSKIAIVEKVGEIPGTSGSQDILSIKQINVYPNPVISAFNIELDGIFDYELIDCSGKSVLWGRANRNSYIGESLQQGLYTLIIKQNKTVYSQKLLKLSN